MNTTSRAAARGSSSHRGCLVRAQGPIVALVHQRVQRLLLDETHILQVRRVECSHGRPRMHQIVSTVASVQHPVLHLHLGGQVDRAKHKPAHHRRQAHHGNSNTQNRTSKDLAISSRLVAIAPSIWPQAGQPHWGRGCHVAIGRM